MQNGDGGLSAVGTAAQPILLRGVEQAGWLGVGFAETGWTGNALENVHFENAYGSPDNMSWTTISGDGDPGYVSVVVGQLTSPISYLRVKDLSFSGPNAARNDIAVVGSARLIVEGTNTGAGTDGGLAIAKLSW